MLRVVTPAAVRRLTTREKVRSLWCLPATDSDDFIDAIIDEASALIAAYLNVESDGLTPVTIGRETVAETFDGAAGATMLRLARLPVAALVSVDEDGVVTPAETGAPPSPNPDFQFEIDAAAGRLWKKSGAARTPFSAARIVVAYAAGWLLPTEAGRTLPDDIEGAAVRLAGRLIQSLREEERPRLEAEALTGLGSWQAVLQKIDWPSGISSDAQAALMRYRRVNL